MKPQVIFEEEHKHSRRKPQKDKPISDTPRNKFRIPFPGLSMFSAENRIKNDESVKQSVEKRRFSSIVRASEQELFHAKSFFPFDFFPDEISIEATQVNIIVKNFFFSEQIHSLPIKNITDCILDVSPFFASIRLVDISFGQNTVDISYLKKSDAKRARRIIQGLMIAAKENIDVTTYNPEELLLEVEKLGAARPIEPFRKKRKR